MGLIAMSEHDLQRIEVLSRVIAGRMTLVTAAHVLALSTRQVRRLSERISTGGAASIRHKAIGRQSNNRICDGVRDYAVAIVRERYADFGPTLAAEKLAEHDGLTVSRETLRQWMSEAGLWLSRQQRRTFHQLRLRREAYGELVQIDGSEHRWFEGRGIDDMEAGNAFLPGFIERYNARFARTPVRPEDLHRPLNLMPDRLQEILCKREQRYVGAQLTFSFERQRIMLEQTEVTRGLVGRYVETYAYADGRLDVRWKGHSLPYTVFDKDQRVTHAAITENKRLSDVLAYIKERQDQQVKPDVKTNSDKNGYVRRARGPGRRKDFMQDPAVIARREKALSRLDAAE